MDAEKSLLERTFPIIVSSIRDLWNDRRKNPKIFKDLMDDVRDMINGDAGWGSTLEPTTNISDETKKILEDDARNTLFNAALNDEEIDWILAELENSFVEEGLLVREK